MSGEKRDVTDADTDWPVIEDGWLVLEDHCEDGHWSGSASSRKGGNIVWETEAIPIKVLRRPVTNPTSERDEAYTSYLHPKNCPPDGWTIENAFRAGWDARENFRPLMVLDTNTGEVTELELKEQNLIKNWAEAEDEIKRLRDLLTECLYAGSMTHDHFFDLLSRIELALKGPAHE